MIKSSIFHSYKVYFTPMHTAEEGRERGGAKAQGQCPWLAACSLRGYGA